MVLHLVTLSHSKRVARVCQQSAELLVPIGLCRLASVYGYNMYGAEAGTCRTRTRLINVTRSFSVAGGFISVRAANYLHNGNDGVCL